METDMLMGVVRLMDMQSHLDPSHIGPEVEETSFDIHRQIGTLDASVGPYTRTPTR